MPGQKLPERQFPNAQERGEERLGIGRQIKGVQLPRVKQISRKEIAAFLFVITQMSGGMSGRMQSGQAPVAEIERVPSFKSREGEP